MRFQKIGMRLKNVRSKKRAFGCEQGLTNVLYDEWCSDEFWVDKNYNALTFTFFNDILYNVHINYVNNFN